MTTETIRADRNFSPLNLWITAPVVFVAMHHTGMIGFNDDMDLSKLAPFERDASHLLKLFRRKLFFFSQVRSETSMTGIQQ